MDDTESDAGDDTGSDRDMNHPRTMDAISPAWVTEILRGANVVRQSSVRAVDISPIGQGVGFLSNRARLTLTYDRAEEGAPATVVVKMPATAKEGVSGGVRGTALAAAMTTRPFSDLIECGAEAVIP